MGFAFAIAFTFRVLALYRGWEEPFAKEPDGVVIHGEGGRSSAASTTASLSASCATSG